MSAARLHPCGGNILLRESYREGGKVKKRTLLNLSDWPPERIAGFKALLKGGTVIPSDQEAISIVRSLPHGHVAAALGTARKIGLDRLIGPEGDRRRDLVLALAVSRILDPGSKLAAARALSPETAGSSLGAELGLGSVDEEELYGALDWLAVRQTAIETALARRHLSGGTLVLYDVTSSYMEGRCCPLAQFGYNRDGKKGKLQIVPHDACIGVHPLGRTVIDHHRSRVQRSAATRSGKAAVRARAGAVIVLIIMVEGTGDIDVGGNGVFRSGPEYSQNLVVGEGRRIYVARQNEISAERPEAIGIRTARILE